jgi:hypothetical protein
MTFITDPYTLLRIPRQGRGSNNDRMWAAADAAIATFDPNKPEPLISLLLDNHWLLRRRGLYIFASLGKESIVALDAALRSADDPDPMARSNLMDGVICYSKSLSPRQAQIILTLADDFDDLVRSKVVVFLGASRRETIKSAIELFENPLRLKYQQCLLMFDADPSQAQSLFERGLAEISVESTFALGSIEKMAREGRLSDAPTYSGDSYIGESTVRNTTRLLKRRYAPHKPR